MTACRSCGAPIIWARTSAGKSMPVDQEPSERGNVFLQPSPVHEGVTLATVLGQNGILEHLAADENSVFHLSHWVTCPDRADWKKRQREVTT